MRKLFYNFKARHQSGEVHLSFYKGTHLYESAQKSREIQIVRILRKEEPNFVFNQDYNEYFDGLDASEADVIYEGALDALNGRKYEYVDPNVQPLKNYVYWVSTDQGDIPVGPIPIRVRDQRVWWAQEEIVSQMKQLADEYPRLVEMKSFGQTIRKNEIQGLIVGNRERCIALVGAVHPGESGPELIIPALARIMRENSHLLEHVGIAILPSVCIDERERLVQGNPSYLRVNSNGVDLNRNFAANWDIVDYNYGLITSDPDAITYRGKHPNSEPETQAMMAFITDTRPVAVFSFHSLASICGPMFLATKFSKDDDDFKRRCQQITSAYTRGFYNQADRANDLRFGTSQGSFPGWLYLEHNIPAFDLEWDGAEESKVSHVDETTPELVNKYQKLHYKGIVAVLESLIVENG